MCRAGLGIAGLLNPPLIGFVFCVGNLISVFRVINAQPSGIPERVALETLDEGQRVDRFGSCYRRQGFRTDNGSASIFNLRLWTGRVDRKLNKR